MFGLTWGPPHVREPCPTLPRLDSPETYGKTKHTGKTKQNNDMIPSDILLYL